MHNLLEKLEHTNFKPIMFCSSGKGQTILTSVYPAGFDIAPTFTHHITLEDQDKIVVMEYQPTDWKNGDRIVILVHGLTGSYKSKYNIRLTREWLKKGYAVYRINLRGCGPGSGLARHPYHSGRSEDTRALISWLYEKYPNSPVTQVGFSLGGNITLKMAAEDGEQPTGNLDSVIAVSPPVDLHACSALLHNAQNRIFEKYFVTRLIEDVNNRRRHFPDIPELGFTPNMSILDFDNTYTAPYSGYADAIDYYTQCSAGMLLDRITIPTFILYAKDDPFITIERFLHKISDKKHIDCLMTEEALDEEWFGSSLSKNSRFWMDTTIVKWLDWYTSKDHAHLKVV